MIQLLKHLSKQLSQILNFFFINLQRFLKFIKMIIYLFHRKPFVFGYDEYKWYRIQNKINEDDKSIEESKAVALDERIIEYKWVINELAGKKGKLLDAGSTINFKPIIDKLENFNITIQTLYPEKNNFNSKSINYIYSDLRDKIFQENYFDFITCISTLEHVGFDNSHYNYYENKKISSDNPKDYLNVIKNFNHILKKDGELLLTLPFGKKQIFKHLQQFDSNEIKNLIETFSPNKLSKEFYIYKNLRWIKCNEEDCDEIKFRTLDEKNQR